MYKKQDSSDKVKILFVPLFSLILLSPCLKAIKIHEFGYFLPVHDFLTFTAHIYVHKHNAVLFGVFLFNINGIIWYAMFCNLIFFSWYCFQDIFLYIHIDLVGLTAV